MVEVIVAAVIFALAAAGIFATITALSKPATESDHSVTAAFLGKQMLEELRTHVDATTWSSAIGNPLKDGTYNSIATPTIDGIDYDISYTVTDDPDSDGRYVTLTVEWDD